MEAVVVLAIGVMIVLAVPALILLRERQRDDQS
jgi:hypothetical protein